MSLRNLLMEEQGGILILGSPREYTRVNPAATDQ